MENNNNLTRIFNQANLQLLISEQNGEAVERLAANQHQAKSNECKMQTDKSRSTSTKRKRSTENNYKMRLLRDSRKLATAHKCPNRLISLRQSASATLLIGLLVPLMLLLQPTTAAAWRFFDSTNPETRLYNAMQPLNLLAAPSPPINQPTQHLRPTLSSNVNQVNDMNAAPVAATQMVADQPQQQQPSSTFGAQLINTVANSIVQSSSARSAEQQQQQQQAPAKDNLLSRNQQVVDTSLPNKQHDSSSGTNLVHDINDNSNKHQQLDNSNAKQAHSPKLAGKILDSLALATAEVLQQVGSDKSASKEQQTNKPETTARNGQPSGEKAGQQVVGTIAHQLLKPRKAQPQDSSAKQVSSAEQQIINQHVSKLHLSPTQRIGNSLSDSLQTKHRGSFVGDKMAASFDSSGGRDLSTLSSIFGNFKSGMTSRSSIIKAAISDNKLARSK